MRRVRLALHKFSTKEGERRVRVDDDAGQAAETDLPAGKRLAAIATRRWRCSRRSSAPGARTRSACISTHLGFPLAGDDKYGDFAWNKALAKQGLKRMFLHAKELAFTHPATGERVRFECRVAARPSQRSRRAWLDA